MLKSFRPAKAQSDNQRDYIKAIRENVITICTGLAGTGKTFLAMSEAIRCLVDDNKIYRRIVIVRPYMPTGIGESIGALPGEVSEKIGPYVQNIRDIVEQLVPRQHVQELMKSVEFTILSLCRGRSFDDSVVIVDEAQNVPENGDAMKMLLSRLGRNGKMILCGDTEQIDLRGGRGQSSLEKTIRLVRGINGIQHVELNDFQDIQRHPIIQKILKRFDERDCSGEKDNY